MPEVNEGYEIIAAEVYRVKPGQGDRIVLGRMETKYGVQFVTWESTVREQEDGSIQTDYFWGHYFNEEAEARADYHKRLHEKYE